MHAEEAAATLDRIAETASNPELAPGDLEALQLQAMHLAQEFSAWPAYHLAGLLALADRFCRADYNRDTFMNGNDYDDFVVDWIDALPAADYDRNGFVNADDFDAFVVEFEQGC